MRKPLFYMLFALMLGGCQSAASYKEVARVKVWNPDFEMAREITDVKDLKRIESVWNNLNRMESFPIPEKLGHFKWYKLDIVFSSDHRGGRWLYDGNGHLMLLTKTGEPRYVIEEFESFNDALGL